MRYLLFLAALASTVIAHAAPPGVVVSIAPIHSLVTRLMSGVTEPHLLLPPGSSPHNYALRPSDMQRLTRADLVIRIGPNLEQFLARPLEGIPSDRIINLIEVPELTLYRYREGGRWQRHTHIGEKPGEAHREHGDEDKHAEATHHDSDRGALTIDNHLWFDPHNAAALVHFIASRLRVIDPANAERYAVNERLLQRDLETLDQELEEHLSLISDRPYLVFHDAYQYLERRYGLNAIGSVVVDADRRPGARRLSELRAILGRGDAHCIFGEPQFNRRLIETLREGLEIGYGELDPVGYDRTDPATLYFELMHANAEALVNCLKP